MRRVGFVIGAAISPLNTTMRTILGLVGVETTVEVAVLALDPSDHWHRR